MALAHRKFNYMIDDLTVKADDQRSENELQRRLQMLSGVAEY